MILDKINGPDDVKKLNETELRELAEEIRSFLIEKISHTGGHLASNLGVVELTIALYLAFDLPKDKIIWDVGHQSYTHKILSGRKDDFDGLRQYVRKVPLTLLIRDIAPPPYPPGLAWPRAAMCWARSIQSFP